MACCSRRSPTLTRSARALVLISLHYYEVHCRQSNERCTFRIGINKSSLCERSNKLTDVLFFLSFVSGKSREKLQRCSSNPHKTDGTWLHKSRRFPRPARKGLLFNWIFKRTIRQTATKCFSANFSDKSSFFPSIFRRRLLRERISVRLPLFRFLWLTFSIFSRASTSSIHRAIDSTAIARSSQTWMIFSFKVGKDRIYFYSPSNGRHFDVVHLVRRPV